MQGITPLKNNIEPENDGLEDDFPLPGGVLSGSSRSSSGRVYSDHDKISHYNDPIKEMKEMSFGKVHRSRAVPEVYGT